MSLDVFLSIQNKITSLDWSRANPDIVVAGDEKGCLIYWDIKSSKKDDAKLLRPDKGYIYSLACSPHDCRIVALGYVFYLELSNLISHSCSNFIHFRINQIFIESWFGGKKETQGNISVKVSEKSSKCS